MFEKLKTPEEIFSFKLGSALTMEKNVLGMLGLLLEAAEPCPAMQGLDKGGKATIKKTDDSIVDAVILPVAIETEHHEIAVYEVLVANAEARGAPEVAALLKENLGQEQHTLEEVKSVAERIANECYAVA